MSRLVVPLLGLALLLAACGGGSAAAGCDRMPGVRAGLCITPADERVAAPTAGAPKLGDPDTEVAVADLGGDATVVNFWGSWCGPCRTEQPELNEVAERFADAVSFVGVNVQDRNESNALAFQREFEPPYPSVFDPAGTYAATFGGVGPSTMPSTILLDADGRVAARLIGSTTATELSVLLTRLLEEG